VRGKLKRPLEQNNQQTPSVKSTSAAREISRQQNKSADQHIKGNRLQPRYQNHRYNHCVHPIALNSYSLIGRTLMVKANMFPVAIAALQLFAAERPIKLDQHLAEMRIISSDASSEQMKLGFKKAIVIDLSKDVKDILVSDPVTVNVIPRTARRVYIIGAAVGKTNIFFYDDGGREIAALDVWVSEIIPARPSEFGPVHHRRQLSDPVSQHFLKALKLRD
jgi:Pilus formation protein N terminal region